MVPTLFLPEDLGLVQDQTDSMSRDHLQLLLKGHHKGQDQDLQHQGLHLGLLQAFSVLLLQDLKDDQMLEDLDPTAQEDVLDPMDLEAVLVLTVLEAVLVQQVMVEDLVQQVMVDDLVLLALLEDSLEDQHPDLKKAVVVASLAALKVANLQLGQMVSPL